MYIIKYTIKQRYKGVIYQCMHHVYTSVPLNILNTLNTLVYYVYTKVYSNGIYHDKDGIYSYGILNLPKQFWYIAMVPKCHGIHCTQHHGIHCTQHKKKQYPFYDEEDQNNSCELQMQ
jgi:hypothetical protein